jgi:hypothetical protein
MPIAANLSVHRAFTSTYALLQLAKIVSIRQSKLPVWAQISIRGKNTNSSEELY